MSKPKKKKPGTSDNKKKRKKKSGQAFKSSVMIEAEWLPADVDPQLLENIKIQWQLGDWESLASLNAKDIEAHPERASIAMLSASAHQQLGQLAKTRELMKRARQWGASKEQVVQVIAAGVHNVLARVAALNNLDERALDHFQNALSLGSSTAPSSYLIQARASAELKDRVAHSTTAQNLTAIAGNYQSKGQATQASEQSDAQCRQAQADWCKGNWQALARLDNADVPNHPYKIKMGIYAACGHQQLGDGEAEQRCAQAVLRWGGEKAQIKRFLLSGIYNRLAKANVHVCNYDEAMRYFRKALNAVTADISGTDKYLKERILSQLKDMPKEDLQELLNRV